MKKILTLITALLIAFASAEEKEKDKDKWDVSKPPGPKKSAVLDVNRGTWLSLDVSPDGRKVVFDMLGDLYLLDIDGGQATSPPMAKGSPSPPTGAAGTISG